ncbi:hypothetical protein PROFUN_11252, partial [Planoprotostelium fungivorum]
MTIVGCVTVIAGFVFGVVVVQMVGYVPTCACVVLNETGGHVTSCPSSSSSHPHVE